MPLYPVAGFGTHSSRLMTISRPAQLVGYVNECLVKRKMKGAKKIKFTLWGRRIKDHYHITLGSFPWIALWNTFLYIGSLQGGPENFHLELE